MHVYLWGPRVQQYLCTAVRDVAHDLCEKCTSRNYHDLVRVNLASVN